jgi:hypothetical protein
MATQRLPDESLQDTPASGGLGRVLRFVGLKQAQQAGQHANLQASPQASRQAGPHPNAQANRRASSQASQQASKQPGLPADPADYVAFHRVGDTFEPPASSEGEMTAAERAADFCNSCRAAVSAAAHFGDRILGHLLQVHPRLRAVVDVMDGGDARAKRSHRHAEKRAWEPPFPAGIGPVLGCATQRPARVVSFRCPRTLGLLPWPRPRHQPWHLSQRLEPVRSAGIT